MEQHPGDRYLHKKFKKQLTIDATTALLQRKSDGISSSASLAAAVGSLSSPPDHHQQQQQRAPLHDLQQHPLHKQYLSIPAAQEATNYVPNNYRINISTNTNHSSKSSISNTLLAAVSPMPLVKSMHQQPDLELPTTISNAPYSNGDHTSQFLDHRQKTDNDISTIDNGSSIPSDLRTSDNVIFSISNIDNVSGRMNNESEASDQHKASVAGKYVCTFCNLSCSKPSVLQKHIRAHTNERPYPCVSCGFSFKTRSNLYKHCRSRTHRNRVMGNNNNNNGNKLMPDYDSGNSNAEEDDAQPSLDSQVQSHRPYKPRFHLDTNNYNTEEARHVNSTNDSYFGSAVFGAERTNEEPLNLTYKNRKRCLSDVGTETAPAVPSQTQSLIKELLLKNLYADGNMQCPHCKMIFRTVTELELHKLKNCRGFTKSGSRYNRSNSVNVASIFTQNRSHFDNVPCIDKGPPEQQQRSQSIVFPLKSPGPFLGKTRLVDGDKQKSFSFEDDIIQNHMAYSLTPSSDPWPQRYSDYSPLPSGDSIKRTPVKLFGGEVKITHQTSGESKSYKIDGNSPPKSHENSIQTSYRFTPENSVHENHVVKNSLQSGGTIVQNKQQYSKRHKPEDEDNIDVIRVFDRPTTINNFIKYTPKIISLNVPPANLISNDMDITDRPMTYTNIKDFSQNAAKLLAPNLRQLNLSVPGIPLPSSSSSGGPRIVPSPNAMESSMLGGGSAADGLGNPMQFMVDGKVVRYVPGMPGPIVADDIRGRQTAGLLRLVKPNVQITPPTDVPVEEPMELATTDHTPKPDEPAPLLHKRFARPNTLPLKPSTVISRQHHGLTPTIFNQILISPDTPRVAKKYNQHSLNGNYFSYLDLKSSTRSVYCTLNKTQPFYVPHYGRLSMYSEWRQQDDGPDKLYASGLVSRQRPGAYSIAGSSRSAAPNRPDDGRTGLGGSGCISFSTNLVQSNYKFIPEPKTPEPSDPCASDSLPKSPHHQNSCFINHMGDNHVSTASTSASGAPPIDGVTLEDDYTYVRGRGRGRFVCDQCGIRCKKPSMLKKHIRTHTNVRPYTCSHCNFSFKTKGNLTKHMKSKAHTKNYTASSGSGSGSSTHQSGNMTSDSSDDDESDMDSSDESTRNQEHEAAYGLLSLSQKPGSSSTSSNSRLSPITQNTSFMDSDQIAHVTKSNYVRNKILTEKPFIPWSMSNHITTTVCNTTSTSGKTSRPLTYPYTSPLTDVLEPLVLGSGKRSSDEDMPLVSNNIKNFNVIKRYDPEVIRTNTSVPSITTNDDWRKRTPTNTPDESTRNFTAEEPKLQRGDIIDLSVNHVDVEQARLNGACDFPPRITVAYSFDGGPKVIAPTILVTESDGFAKQQPSPVPQLTNHVSLYDNSAMETLADIATKQVKLERNAVAKDVASEFLKLATKNSANEIGPGTMMNPSSGTNHQKDVTDLMGKVQENKSCTVCGKSFNKPSQLRLHMNIHYLERPFRCESCSVSFRTKGHLQKHERSAGHHNKLCSSPALVTSEPRPFKCADCNIAFRIHGHLAKHLRSKMHIMKLECLSKIPFGLYAELERSNSLLTEINTADGDQCLSSLKMLAKKVFMNDPSKLNYMEVSPHPHPHPALDVIEMDN